MDPKSNTKHSVNPARQAEAIDVSSGDHTLTLSARGLYVGGAGDVACRFADDDSDVTLVGVAAGSVLPISLSVVRQTATTATNMVAIG